MKWFGYILLLIPVSSYSQDTIQHNFTLNGYVTDMQSFVYQSSVNNPTIDNVLHNRLNFKWNNTANTLNGVLELRNRLLMGETVNTVPGYANIIGSDNGLMDLSFNIASGKSYVLNTRIDRLFVDYTKNKFQMRLGRQRINWGQCFVWNPNDIFNAYSYFDFDYVEKPGSDAVRLQYYRNSTSTFDFVIKADSASRITSALLYRFNRWNYDIQFMGGILNDEDLVLGTGWSGNIFTASFTGEVSYFHPKKNFADTTGLLIFSVGSQYSFKNSFMLQTEVLYNPVKSGEIKNFGEYFMMNLSAKNLSFPGFSIMLQSSYPVTPLFNVSLAGMYFPRINGYYIGPTLSYSILENLDFSVITQTFAGQLVKGYKQTANLIYLHLKWNF